MDMRKSIEIFDLNCVLRKELLNFDKLVEEEKNELRKKLKLEDLDRLYNSLRLNYDNTLWSQKVIAMSLNNFSSESMNSFLENHNSDIANKVYEYKALWNVVEKSEIIEKLFPNHIRATPHTFKRDHKISFHLIGEKTIILPWMGVGVIKQSSQAGRETITVKYEHEINNQEYLPIFLANQETAFGYIKSADSRCRRTL